jgi:hypothetical protein
LEFILGLYLVVSSLQHTGPNKLTSFLQEEEQQTQQEEIWLICLFINIKIPNPNPAVKLKFTRKIKNPPILLVKN